MSKHTVTFLPERVSVEVEAGQTLLEAAAAADVGLIASCGGQGVCGKCKVHIVSGHPGGISEPQRPELSAGVALACQTMVEGDLVVEVPRETQRREARILTSQPSTVVGLPAEEAPLSECVTLELPPAGAVREADAERLVRALSQTRAAWFDEVRLDMAALRALPAASRRGEPLGVAVGDFDGIGRVIGVEPRNGHTAYGLAVDVGTTTVVVRLIDLATGAVVDTSAQLNDQAVYGADVISRIIHAQESAQGGQQLREAVVDTINACIGELARKHHLWLYDVIGAALVGNTVMTHLLLGIDAASIRREPYVPVVRSLPTLRASDVGLAIHPGAPVYLAPCVSSYVGGDITAGVLATGIAGAPEMTLFVDLGTNGEMVITQEEWMVCCSCSAGPAFEGSGLDHGTYAREGAIERVFYDAATDQVHYHTIGEAPPLGICGSGYVDLLAELLRAGVIDRSGHIDRNFPSPRVRLREDQPEFVVAWAQEAAGESDICIGQDDIETLLRSKSAVYSGVATLLESLGLNPSGIGRLLLAGGFGNYLDPDNAVTIGLIPDLPRERIQFVGNSALAGATQALLRREARRRLESIAGRMTNFELSSVPGYMERYVSSLFLPHTDLSLFPSVKLG